MVGSDLIVVSSDACRTTNFDNGADVVTGFPSTDETDGVVTILTRVGVAPLLTTDEGVGDGWLTVETGVPGWVFGVTMTNLGWVVVGTAEAVAAVRGTVRRVEDLVIAGITRVCWKKKIYICIH